MRRHDADAPHVPGRACLLHQSAQCEHHVSGPPDKAAQPGHGQEEHLARGWGAASQAARRAEPHGVPARPEGGVLPHLAAPPSGHPPAKRHQSRGAPPHGQAPLQPRQLRPVRGGAMRCGGLSIADCQADGGARLQLRRPASDRLAPAPEGAYRAVGRGQVQAGRLPRGFGPVRAQDDQLGRPRSNHRHPGRSRQQGRTRQGLPLGPVAPTVVGLGEDEHRGRRAGLRRPVQRLGRALGGRRHAILGQGELQ
mmetsp:Transcript_54493/g.140283  ORF Transcript_54493/g.140283 Transcript_54493/m.140283 type:complete len:252 (-) Transcript_54493:866-1621(-)